MDVAEAALSPGVEPSEVVVSGPGVLCVIDEVRRDKLVEVSIVDKGAPVDVLEGIEVIVETWPRLNVSLSPQQEVELLLS